MGQLYRQAAPSWKPITLPDLLQQIVSAWEGWDSERVETGAGKHILPCFRLLSGLGQSHSVGVTGGPCPPVARTAHLGAT